MWSHKTSGLSPHTSYSSGRGNASILPSVSLVFLSPVLQRQRKVRLRFAHQGLTSPWRVMSKVLATASHCQLWCCFLWHRHWPVRNWTEAPESFHTHTGLGCCQTGSAIGYLDCSGYIALDISKWPRGESLPIPLPGQDIQPPNICLCWNRSKTSQGPRACKRK